MPGDRMGSVRRYLQRLAEVHASREIPDAELLNLGQVVIYRLSPPKALPSMPPRPVTNSKGSPIISFHSFFWSSVRMATAFSIYSLLIFFTAACLSPAASIRALASSLTRIRGYRLNFFQLIVRDLQALQDFGMSTTKYVNAPLLQNKLLQPFGLLRL